MPIDHRLVMLLPLVSLSRLSLCPSLSTARVRRFRVLGCRADLVPVAVVALPAAGAPAAGKLPGSPEPPVWSLGACPWLRPRLSGPGHGEMV
jgi:hypothetical protein